MPSAWPIRCPSMWKRTALKNGVTREQIQQAVRKVFDLRPAAIIDELDLKRPIYSKTAAYGHFGRNDADFTWETTNKVDELKAAIEG